MAERSLAGEALTNLILGIFRLNGVILAVGDRITKPYGLTSARWQVMGAIDLAGQPLTVPQIARRMGLTRQGVQRIINDLERLGMVILEENIDHKRAKLVSLTKVGKQTLAQIDKEQAVWVNQLSENLSDKEINQALKVVQSIIERSE